MFTLFVQLFKANKFDSNTIQILIKILILTNMNENIFPRTTAGIVTLIIFLMQNTLSTYVTEEVILL